MDGDECVACVGARWSGGEHDDRGQLSGQVFERVDGEIDSPVSERLFNLFGEHALRADLLEGNILQPVAGGLDDLNLDGIALTAQEHSNVICLPESKL